MPALLSERRVVVATATKALQDQLAGKDLPFVTEHLDLDADVAVLKGRSNYVCLQRLREATGGDDQAALELDDELADLGPVLRGQLSRLASWAATSPTGDQAELTWAVNPRAWQAVSVSSDECPGATRCPLGEPCFAEVARRRAQAADLVVVNTHLYGLNVAGGEALLPEHDVVVFDEAHQLEDIISATAGLSLGAGRFSALARVVRAVLTTDGPRLLEQAGDALAAALQPRLGQRLPDPLPVAIADALVLGRGRVDEAQAGLRAIDTGVGEANQRKVRAQKAATALIEHLDASLAVRPGFVAFVAGTASAPRLEVAPIEVDQVLAPLWDKRTAVLTSATIPLRLPERLGLPADRTDVLDVGSPFDYGEQALLVLRGPPARPPQPGLPRAEPPGAGGAHRRGGRAHAGAVHQLARHAGRGRRPPAEAGRPVLTQSDLPSRRCWRPSPVRSRAACSPPPGSSRASTCPGPRSAW